MHVCVTKGQQMTVKTSGNTAKKPRIGNTTVQHPHQKPFLQLCTPTEA